MTLSDGIEVFKAQTDPKVIAEWLGEMTIWVDPKTFRRLPVWAPYTARKAPLFKANWEDRQTNKGEPKQEGNVAASKALTTSLGLSQAMRKNWSCCHIWGNDDESFQSDASEVNDPRYFTCVGNMVLVPSPLKTFTDTIPEVKHALRYVANRMYGFCPEGRTAPSSGEAGDFLPKGWDCAERVKCASFSRRISDAQNHMIQSLRRLQSKAGSRYPRDQVIAVARYWHAKCPDSLLGGLLS